MRVQYVCPVKGCGLTYSTAEELRGHMAGTMQYREDHEWSNVPIHHNDLSEAREEVPGVTDF